METGLLLHADAVISPHQGWELIYFPGSHLSIASCSDRPRAVAVCLLFLIARVMGHEITTGEVGSALPVSSQGTAEGQQQGGGSCTAQGVSWGLIEALTCLCT